MTRYLALSIALLSVLVFINSFPGQFFTDDLTIVMDNPLVTKVDLYKTLTTDYWGKDTNSGLYRPLTILSLALNRALLGPAPWSFHAVNVLLHAVVALLLFHWIYLYCREPFLAWLAAALFAVHPIHADVVNTAVGRSELLVALFLLLAACAARHSTRLGRLTLFSAYALALLAKEHAIVFLALLPLIEGFCSESAPAVWRRRIGVYGVLAGITVAWLMLRAWGVDRNGIPLNDLDPVYVPLAFLPTTARILTAIDLQVVYLGKLLIPTKLQHMYGGDGFLQPVSSVVSPRGVALLLLVATAAAALWFGWRRRSPLGLAAILYLASFSVTANVIFATGVTFADRLAYLPSAWFCLGTAVLVRRVGIRLAPRGALGLGVVAVLLLFALTVGHNRHYRDPLVLWNYAVATDSQNPLARMMLGTTYFALGGRKEAERYYLDALRLERDFADALNNYAHLLYEEGRYREAAAQARKALAVADGHYASASVVLAKTMLQLQQWDAILDSLEKIPAHLKRTEPIYWELRGRALNGKGELREALEAYQREYQLMSESDSDVLERIGTLYLALEDYTQAETHFRRYLDRHESARSWNGLGAALGLQERPGEAVQAFANAVRLDPASVEYRRNYEFALTQMSGTP